MIEPGVILLGNRIRRMGGRLFMDEPMVIMVESEYNEWVSVFP